jgi:hypothetical protein
MARIKFVGKTLVVPRSRYPLTNVTTGNDQEGSYNMSASGTVTWYAAGNGIFEDDGRADFTNDVNARLSYTGDFGGSANQDFTICGWVRYQTFSLEDHIFRIQAPTNSSHIGVYNVSLGDIQFTRTPTSGAGGDVSTGLRLGVGSWRFIAIGHDATNNEVFLWHQGTKYTYSDLGDYDFTEAGTVQYAGGFTGSGKSINGFITHMRVYLGRAFDAIDNQQMRDYGELFDDWDEVTSQTAIKRFGFATYDRPSITAIKRLGFGKAEMDDPIQGLNSSRTRILNTFETTTTSLSRIKRLKGGILGKLSRTRIEFLQEKQFDSNTTIKRFSYVDMATVSDTAIMEVMDITKASDTTITISTDVTKESDTKIILQFDITHTSNTRILVGITEIALLSDVRMKNTLEVIFASDTSIIEVFDIMLGSNTRIKEDAFTQIWYRSDTLILNRIEYSRTSIAAIKRTRLPYNTPIRPQRTL